MGNLWNETKLLLVFWQEHPWLNIITWVWFILFLLLDQEEWWCCHHILITSEMKHQAWRCGMGGGGRAVCKLPAMTVPSSPAHYSWQSHAAPIWHFVSAEKWKTGGGRVVFPLLSGCLGFWQISLWRATQKLHGAGVSNVNIQHLICGANPVKLDCVSLPLQGIPGSLHFCRGMRL